jgi:valyl-tRNA synthetase
VTPSTPDPQADPLSKQYDPSSVEDRIYRAWEEGGHFRPKPDAPRPPYTIVIPPPNVTDRLHLGHALNNALQDILVRWRRMQGRRTLWLPGTDHAGIATQAVVERRMFEEEGKTRHDVGREGLVERIWAWRKRSGDLILEQLKRVGCSCDWSRTRFTLDETCARAVRVAFYRMFCDGLIYRGLRLVNWDTHLQTAVADDEVYHETVAGHLWHIRYPVQDAPDEFVTVATTRPETMLGDTAVAVHPDDERYRHLIGRNVVLPLLERPLPVVADGQLVDPAFGSGCVKVTPAHDPNDYEAGIRNGLEMINILTPDGHINENGGPYEGLDRFEARKRVVEDLEAQGLLERIEPYQTEIGHSDRSKTPVEPYLSDQWFIAMGDLAEWAMEAVRDGRVRFHPDRYASSYLDWLGQKRDWCISRQLWWGHRIPVWKGPADSPLLDAAQTAAADAAAPALWQQEVDGTEVAVRLTTEADERVAFIAVPEGCEATERHLEEAGFVRDPDVLDTWFSSALWPFSTLGWPEETDDLGAFYPTDVLVTAREIITLWVARMVVMGLYHRPVAFKPGYEEGRDDVPFSDVYIHAMIQDGEGRPMKKSLGNGVDPLDVVHTHGADALRFTLAWMTTETQDVRMPVETDPETGRNTSPKFDQGRNFCNKVWNAVRFALMNLEGAGEAVFDAKRLRLEDRWILSRTEHIARKVTGELEAFHFQASLMALYDFFWHDVCDWYLETVKPRLADEAERPTAQRVLAFVLDRALRLMHPYVPFITEAAWEGLNATVADRTLPGLAEAPAGEWLIAAAWPEPNDALLDEEAEREFGLRQEIIDGVRRAKAESGQSASWVKAHFPETGGRDDLVRATFDDYAHLAGVTAVNVGKPLPEETVFASAYVGCLGESAYVPISEEQVQAERERIDREIADKRKVLERAEAKLASEAFVTKAPAEVVDRERERAQEARAAIEVLEKRRAELG